MSARIKPHKVRGRKLEEVREKDPDGRIVYHHRTVDTLGKMLRAGTIDQAMHDAAKAFQAAFIIGQLDPLRALPILRVPGTKREPDLNERQLHRAPSGAPSDGGVGRHLQPGRLVRLACGRAAAQRPRVVDAARLGWTAGRANGGKGDPGGCTGGVGGA